MDDEIRMLAQAQNQLFSTADAERLGYGHRAIRRAVDGRRWVRVRRGYYVLADVWAAAPTEVRHLLVARAVARSCGDRVALSHTTGALALGAEFWKPDLTSVHVTRLDGSAGGLEHGVAHHEQSVRRGDCIRLDEDLVVVPQAVAIIGAMMMHSLDQAVVIGDSAARFGITQAEELQALAEAWQRTPATRHVRVAVHLVNGRSATVGETLGRLLFWRGGLPTPLLQFEVMGPTGQHAFTDYGWPDHRVVGEFDGKVKYRRGMRAGESPSDVVVREKKREEWIVETRLTMRRLIWAELFTPKTTLERFRAALATGRRHFV